MKQKRIVIRVMWDRKRLDWYIKSTSTSAPEFRQPLKAETVKRGRALARWYAQEGHPAQLLIYTKAGRIGRGRNAEASYGCDSKAPG